MPAGFKNSRKLWTNGQDPNIPVRLLNLENNEYKVTYYEIISGTSGSLTLPTGATINAGEFGLSGNCILSKIDGSNKPTFESPKTSGGTIVTASLNEVTGDWVASGTYTDSDVALIYSIKIKAVNYGNLDYNFIIETIEIDTGVQSVTGANVDNTDPLNPVVLTPTLQDVITESPTVNGVVMQSLDTQTFVLFDNSGIGFNTLGVFQKNGNEIATVSDIPSLSGYELLSNKQTDLTASATKYPTVDAVNTGLDLKQNKPIIVSASQTAELDERYVVNATSTFTDPTPVEGKGFYVTVINGTATVGGTAYSILGTQILRMYHSGAWVTYINYADTEFVDISGTSTIVGWSSFTTKHLQERVKGKMLNITCFMSGTSDSTSTTFTLSQNATSNVTAQYFPVKFTNNGAASATFGMAEIIGGTNIVTIYRTNTGTSWTSSGTKTIAFSAEIQL